MRLRNVHIGWMMTALAMVRSRIALLLLFVIPTVFYAIIILTTKSDTVVGIELASIRSDELIEVKERHKSLIFIGLTAVALLTSFLALSLIQRQSQANRRLVLCGYRPSELIVSKLAVLVCMIVLIASYVAAMIPPFFQPERFALVMAGFMLIGYVYACYGLLVGSIFRRELEGILFIILLANLDAGWLQNPIYYANAQNRAIIRVLPAYFPSQVSMVSAFTDGPVGSEIVSALLYGTALLLAATLIFWLRMRTSH